MAMFFVPCLLAIIMATTSFACIEPKGTVRCHFLLNCNDDLIPNSIKCGLALHDVNRQQDNPTAQESLVFVPIELDRSAIDAISSCNALPLEPLPTPSATGARPYPNVYTGPQSQPQPQPHRGPTRSPNKRDTRPSARDSKPKAKFQSQDEVEKIPPHVKGLATLLICSQLILCVLALLLLLYIARQEYVFFSARAAAHIITRELVFYDDEEEEKEEENREHQDNGILIAVPADVLPSATDADADALPSSPAVSTR
ncbi:uncharacterized protein DSM5745_07145 [Aspergillus mulundensis]|uniref:Uncharacterized protein n=1 Tax=Aspergillus mulundensis TaxID=1810919 RepID=A0A3D8RKB7_9EURO|nr:hypothetical protein DSM5745_07145 [Aspergillus mulundensis]RDW74483.1 hypothetical protein DSM5745_07145 [Aspergillus mulundensis]